MEPELAEDPQVLRLRHAFAICSGDEVLLEQFLRALMSPSEIRAMAKRLAAAELLIGHASQPSIAASLNMSTKTVSRVAEWAIGIHAARNGAYKEVVMRMNKTEEG